MISNFGNLIMYLETLFFAFSFWFVYILCLWFCFSLWLKWSGIFWYICNKKPLLVFPFMWDLEICVVLRLIHLFLDNLAFGSFRGLLLPEHLLVCFSQKFLAHSCVFIWRRTDFPTCKWKLSGTGPLCLCTVCLCPEQVHVLAVRPDIAFIVMREGCFPVDPGGQRPEQPAWALKQGKEREGSGHLALVFGGKADF